MSLMHVYTIILSNHSEYIHTVLALDIMMLRMSYWMSVLHAMKRPLSQAILHGPPGLFQADARHDARGERIFLKDLRPVDRSPMPQTSWTLLRAPGAESLKI